jgi:hypothetical protein
MRDIAMTWVNSKVDCQSSDIGFNNIAIELHALTAGLSRWVASCYQPLKLRHVMRVGSLDQRNQHLGLRN